MGVFHAPRPHAHPKEGGQYIARCGDFSAYYDTYQEALYAYLGWWQVILAAARYRARVATGAAA